tara:strand:+ start:197972 stop:198727 length:756 start_codon:yes stop_codon:yes gene_type:complete
MADDNTTQHTRTIIEQYSEHWQALDLEAILALYADDIEYFDFFANEKIPFHELRDYVSLSLPRSPKSAIRSMDRIRVDGDTGFSQYTYVLEQNDGRVVTYQNAEAITVKNGKIIRIHEYSSLIHTDDSERSTDEIRKLGLTPSRCHLICQELEDYFNLARPFLSHQITLADIATPMGYTRNQLSYVLNHSLGRSFYEYLNEARIAYLLEYRTNDESLTEAAHNAGFSSVSTFYKFFKRYTGTTPGKYFSRD